MLGPREGREVRIFVSSTFEDLREQREAVIRSLLQLGHEVVAMEYFTAETAPPVEVVLKKITTCQAYIGLFAWRYGYVPTDLPAEVPEQVDSGQTSITHIEYLAAKQAGKEILAFLIRESAPWPPHLMDAFSVEPLSPTSAATDRPGHRIRELRNQLQRERIVAYFDSSADLEARVTAAVSNLSTSLGVRTNLVHLTQPVQVVSDSEVSYGIRQEIDMAVSNGKRLTTIDISSTWWMTRLYYLASLARAFTRIERIVVIERETFVGTVAVSNVVTRLAPVDKRFRAYEVALRRGPSGVVDQNRALARAGTEWDRLFVNERDNPVLVTKPNLESWFGDALVGGAIEIAQADQTTLLELMRIMSFPMEFVPVVARNAPLGGDPGDPVPSSWAPPVTLIDKRSLTDQLAQLYIDELVDRARLT
jgi:hypothetical protein